MEASSSSVFPHCHQDKINLLKMVCKTLYDLVSVCSPESCLSMTPHIPIICPSFFYIINLLLLSPCSHQPAIWSPCCARNTSVTFREKVTGILSAWNSKESGALFHIIQYDVFSILFKCLLTEACLDLPM